MGIDLKTFEPKYEVLADKKDLVSRLKNLVKTHDLVYLASDDDREGAMIASAWIQFLSIPVKKQVRVLFHEITEKGVKEGLKNKTALNVDMVESAMARAEDDKIIGWRISPFIHTATGGTSAGRVQSATLILGADREIEIASFVKEKYYEVNLPFTKNGKEYIAKYKGTTSKKISSFKDKSSADSVVKDCKGHQYTVSTIIEKDRNVSAKLPYTTSTYEQDASAKLGFDSEKAMKLAQKLYEGGHITYMRTDSLRFSDEFIADAKKVIEKNYGKNYYLGFPKVKQAANAQEAHESIRPTHIEKDPTMLVGELSQDELRVYRLIYLRSLAALMSQSIMVDTTVTIQNGEHLFGITAHRTKFDGYKAAYNFSDDEEDGNELPELKTGEIINSKDLIVQEKETTPPSRYTEGKLIKEMEDTGIGRPSTYASTIKILKDRGYITVDKKSIVVTELGLKVAAILRKYFPSIINIEYTANMERELDDIYNKKKTRFDHVSNCFKTVNKAVLDAQKKYKEERGTPDTYEGATCKLCGAPLYYRQSKAGVKFLACSKYPRCKFTAALDSNGKIVEKEVNKPTKFVCPKCGKGHLIKRTAKATGEVFYACTNFTKGCKFTMKEHEFDEQYKKGK